MESGSWKDCCKNRVNLATPVYGINPDQNWMMMMMMMMMVMMMMMMMIMVVVVVVVMMMLMVCCSKLKFLIDHVHNRLVI